MTFFAKSVIGNLAFSPDVYFYAKPVIVNLAFFPDVYFYVKPVIGNLVFSPWRLFSNKISHREFQFFSTRLLFTGEGMFYYNSADAEGRKPYLFAAPASILLSHQIFSGISFFLLFINRAGLARRSGHWQVDAGMPAAEDVRLVGYRLKDDHPPIHIQK